MTREQVAWRLLRDLDAEFIAVGEDASWAVVSMERPGILEEIARTAAQVTEDGVELVDANTTSSDEIRRILDGATVIVGATARTAGGEPLRRMIDLHYDVPVGIRPLKDRVNRYVFGYRLTMKKGGRRRFYRYGGVVHRKGVRWIGQSVLRLPPSTAEEVEFQLRSWGIPVTREEVFESY